MFWSGLRRGVALSGSVSCFRIFSAPDVLVAGPGILVSDHYLFRERRLQESSESEGMFFARYMQVHEIRVRVVVSVCDADATRVFFFVENEECVGSCCSFRSSVVPMDTLFRSRRQHVGMMGEEPPCATQGRTFDKNDNFEVVLQ